MLFFVYGLLVSAVFYQLRISLCRLLCLVLSELVIFFVFQVVRQILLTNIMIFEVVRIFVILSLLRDVFAVEMDVLERSRRYRSLAGRNVRRRRAVSEIGGIRLRCRRQHTRCTGKRY